MLCAITISIELRSLAELVLPLPFIFLTGWLANRLLNVRRGFWPAAGAAVLGWLVGIVAVGLTLRGVFDDAAKLGALDLVVVMLLVTFFGTVATMFLAVGFDLVKRPARFRPEQDLGRIGAVPRPIRALRRRVAPVRRFVEISNIARRNHLGEALRHRGRDEVLAERLATTLQECGGLFVKLGQVASTRADIFPPAVVEALSRLQSDVAPESADAVRDVVEAELGGRIEDHFTSFDMTPLAAASIGQTHRAVLADGRPVVVKVQRPGVADLVGRDANALLSAARFVQRRTTLGLDADIVALAQEFVDGLIAELDFRSEAQSGIHLAANQQARGAVGVTVPWVDVTHSTRRLLVEAEVAGRPLSDAAAVDAAAVGRDELARRLLHEMLDEMLQDGFFHADPHPGNVFVRPDGELVLIDLGSTGVLDAKALAGLQKVLVAAVTKDTALLRRAVLDIAPAGDDVDVVALEADLGRFMATTLQSSGGFDADMLRDMVGLLRRNRLRVPSGLTLFSRALVTLEGTLRVLDPDFVFVDEAKRIATGWIQGRLTRELDTELRNQVMSAMPSLQALPSLAEDLAVLARSGTLTTRVRLFGVEEDRTLVERLTGRALMVIVGGFGLIGSGLLAIAAAATAGALRSTLLFLTFAGVLSASALMLRVVAGVVRDGAA